MSQPTHLAKEPVKLGGTSSDGRPIYSDAGDIINAMHWLIVLASRPLFATLTREPDRAHLVHLLDIFIAYAARDCRYGEEDFEPVPWDQREPLARRLRDLIRAWTPPGLPQEITAGAQALLHAEGREEPPGGWDCFVWDAAAPIEEVLAWPEGTSLMLNETLAAAAMSVEEFLGPKKPPWNKEETGYIETTCSYLWNGAIIYGHRVIRSRTGELPKGAEREDVHGAIVWFMVLASPPLYHALSRKPDRRHLRRLLDVYIAYTVSGPYLTPAKKSHTRRLAEREPLARALAALLETWTSPDLPPTVTEAARALVEAEGLRPPEGGWDNLTNDQPFPLEDLLLWPEGIPIVLRLPPPVDDPA